MDRQTVIPILNRRGGQPLASAGAILRQLPKASARALYIHVPFCFHKCHYCDFYSIVDTRDRQSLFLDRLCRELSALAPWAAPLSSIFVGGGTPTLLQPDLWKRLLTHLHASFDVPATVEFTVECNPETATGPLFDILVTGGVNRLSIGAQSFDPRHLKTLERWHDPANVARALSLARVAGISRQSLDLIYAIPHQTLGDLRADLAQALSLGTTHVSAYSLTYEPATAMTARLARGDFPAADEDTDADMFCLVLGTLRASDLERYEVSNFAVPGDECRHNLAYWRQDPWLAAGPAASAHMHGWRWKNVPRLDDYLSFSDEGFAPVIDAEPAESARNLAERLMTGLRMSAGLDTAAMLEAAGPDAPRFAAAITRHQGLGNIAPGASRTQLTDAGFLLADLVAADLMRTLHHP